MRRALVISAFAAAVIASSASTVPPELAVIGEPSTVLNLTFSVGSTEVSFKPGEFLNATSMHKHPPPLHPGPPTFTVAIPINKSPEFQPPKMHLSRTCMTWD